MLSQTTPPAYIRIDLDGGEFELISDLVALRLPNLAIRSAESLLGVATQRKISEAALAPTETTERLAALVVVFVVAVLATYIDAVGLLISWACHASSFNTPRLADVKDAVVKLLLGVHPLMCHSVANGRNHRLCHFLIEANNSVMGGCSWLCGASRPA